MGSARSGSIREPGARRVLQRRHDLQDSAGYLGAVRDSADPAVGQAWRAQTFPDDPFRETNTRGTVAFAFAVPDGRTTQVFINLRDNSATHDKEPFVPFGRVTEGLDVADRFFSGYGEGLGGMRAGKQDPAFAEGNVFFDRVYPKLDRIKTASIVVREP